MILTVFMVMFFTFKKLGQSRDLSKTVRMWLVKIRVQVDYKSLWSYIHILKYLIVGVAVFES